VREKLSLSPPPAGQVRKVQVSVLESAEVENEEQMTCLRCKSQMYQVVGPTGAKATCSGCSQYVDCAQCSNQKCADTRCLACYNKAVTGVRKPAGGPLLPQDEDI